MNSVKTIKIQNSVVIVNKQINSFVKFLDVAPLTVRSYTSGLKQFFSYLQINEVKILERNNIVEFKKSLINSGKKPATVALYLSAVKKFFAWCESEGICSNLAAGVKAPKVDKFHKKDCLSGNQIREIMQTVNTSSLQGLRDFAILALVSVCGLRTIEVTRANIEDLQLNAGRAILHVQGKGRNSKSEFVNIPEKVLVAIRLYLQARGSVKPSEPLFASCSRRNRGGRLTTMTISTICKRAMVRAGFISARLTAHSLRHSAVTLALLAGLSIQEVSAFARHANIQTTLVYSHEVNRLQSQCENAIASQIF